MEFQNNYISCKIEYLDNFKYVKIYGQILNRDKYKNVVIMAPQSIDKMSSYSGTGLPFPCADIAFEGTKNIYQVNSLGMIDILFTYPNSYYSVANKQKVVSSIFFIFENMNDEQEFVRIELKDLYPLRSLVNRETRTGPEFYSSKYEMLPIDTAEIVMREYCRLKTIKNLA